MKKQIAISLLLMLALLAACASSEANQAGNQDLIATAVAATQAAQQQEAQVRESQPEEGQPAPEIPSQAACAEINTLFGQYLGFEGEISAVTYSDPESGVNGAGCQLYASTSGDQVDAWWNQTTTLLDAISAAGWQQDPNFSADGAAGRMVTVRRSGTACTLISEAGPEDPSLCLENESIVACLERLDPAYVLLEFTAGCTVDSYVPPEEDESSGGTAGEEDIRISFDPGSISAYVSGKLEVSTSQRYVLWASEGQEMTVSLGSAPPLNAILVIYGKDGSVLISDHATTPFWTGTLPSTQDYYIRVVGSPAYPVSYYMQVIIPPVGESYLDGYRPMEMAACQSLSNLIGGITGVETTIKTGLFTDHIANSSGRGCVITSWGRFNQFADRSATSTAVQNALVADGWTQAEEYGAGGVGGFMTGYTKGENLCLYTEMVHEMDPWVCQDVDGPIFECWNVLDDSQMYLEYELNCAVQQ